ncbi:hypothetical protein MTBPR1_120091 [Candidatus Terasakiella magnetica]|uniref:Uncharacterized protein n=1 Tax=Candidatus Terasakiella magnetica TaxID=1867952 RepID=A0A1C3REV2_9PROT|nr:hypothetical protein MTBPR1_120091 [Candidatus Terasakiella magnetica]
MVRIQLPPPLLHQGFDEVYKEEEGGVAQLVRASACHAEGREFESRHSRHFFFENNHSVYYGDR